MSPLYWAIGRVLWRYVLYQRVASLGSNPALVVRVSCHLNITVLTPAFTPTVRKEINITLWYKTSDKTRHVLHDKILLLRWIFYTYMYMGVKSVVEILFDMNIFWNFINVVTRCDLRIFTLLTAHVKYSYELGISFRVHIRVSVTMQWFIGGHMISQLGHSLSQD